MVEGKAGRYLRHVHLGSGLAQVHKLLLKDSPAAERNLSTGPPRVRKRAGRRRRAAERGQREE